MSKTLSEYRIVAARPKNAGNHLNSEFKVYELANAKWSPMGWKSIDDVSRLLRAGHEVRTGRVVDRTMQSGEAVELELRIAKNGTKFTISDMLDT